MENKDKAFEALKKIEKVIDGVRDMPLSIKKGQTKTLTKKHEDSIKILKRVDRIIVNYNKSNAEMKLANLLSFLNHFFNKKK